jgi:hypothetical protein
MSGHGEGCGPAAWMGGWRIARLVASACPSAEGWMGSRQSPSRKSRRHRALRSGCHAGGSGAGA